MASRRKKQVDLLEQLVGLILVGTFFLSFFLTNSLKVSAIITGAVIGLLIAIRIIQNFNYDEKLKKSGIFDIDKMDGRQFEYYLKLLYKNQGFTVKETRITGDFGADLILEKNGRRIVVQAKRYSKNVGIKAVQEAQAAIAYYSASEAWVASNRDYTDAAYNLAKSNNVKLINRKELIDMILKMNPENVPNAKKVIEEHSQEEAICDRCGSPMVIRTGTRGEFYGCSNFPKCRNTKAIDFNKKYSV